MLNVLYVEEENSLFPPFLLSFEIFNFNVQKCLVDYGASINVIILSISNKINAQWSNTTTKITQLDRTFAPSIGDLKDVII